MPEWILRDAVFENGTFFPPLNEIAANITIECEQKKNTDCVSVEKYRIINDELY